MVFILHKLLYKRVLDMLGKRTERIEQSIKDADTVKEQLANAKKDYEAEIARARQEAAHMLSQAQERAKVQADEIVAQARQESDRIREDARQQSLQERDQLMREVKDQVSELVAMVAGRVLQAEVSSKHNRLIDESLAEFGRQN
jgi:F-type H+-transporting ATPase subunit b